MASIQISPYSLQIAEGSTVVVMGLPVRVLASTGQSGGAFSLFDVDLPAGFASGLHIHYMEDVAVFVLEGSLTFFWGDEKRSAAAGSYFFQPRGIPHGFRVEGDIPARILYFAIPSGFEDLLSRLSEASHADCTREAARYKVEILGPLPE